MRPYLHRFLAVGGLLLFASLCAAAQASLRYATPKAFASGLARQAGPKYFRGDATTPPVTTPATCPDVNFAAPRNFGVGQYTYSVAVGDFNGDGKQDLATANEFSNNVSILLGDGAGHFSTATNFNAGDGPKSIVLSDFNGDGKQDVAVANYFSGNVSLLLGDGTGHFSPATNFAVGSYATSVVVSDFNGDARQDLAVTWGTSGKVAILLGDGMGHFTAPTHFAVGSYPESVAVGDFNGDGNQDLAVANSDSHNVSILLGDGAGHFSPATNFPAGSGPYSIAVGDFNGDDNQDLVVTHHYDSSSVSIFLGDGAGHFGPDINFSAGDSARSVTVGDFNGDGNQDLAVANYGSPNVSILLGDGATHFSAPINFLAGAGPVSIAVGDFNGDSRQDLAVANNTSNNVSILLRDCTPRPAPTLTHFAVTAPGYAYAGYEIYLSVAAKDQFNTTVTGYPGTVHFTASCQAYLPPDSPLLNGMSTFETTLNELGYQTVTVTDTADSSITGTSNPVFVMQEGPPPPSPSPSPTPTASPTATATGTPIPTPPTTPTPMPCVIFSLRENFDTVTPPALPAGWHSSFIPGPASCAPAGTCPLGTNWITNSGGSGTSPHCAFHDAPGCVIDSALDTFSFVGLSGSFLHFDHKYDLEDGFDGAVLEISINGGPFIDFIDAGGSFMFGGYNGTIATGSQSPIEGRQAWTGQSDGFVGAVANLPAAAWSQNVTLRFRLATDCITSSAGWRIDDAEVVFLIPCGTPTPTPSPSPTATPTASPSPTPLTAHLLNISTRMRVGFGANVMISGFIITGNAPKTVAVRGLGPSLGVFGIPDLLVDPTLKLHDTSGTLLMQNDNWQDDPAQAAQLTALGLALQNTHESGLVTTLTPGPYYVILAGNNNGTGVGLLEVYDVNSAAGSQLAEIATRGFVQTGDNVMIGGFILNGSANNATIAVRGLGPTLQGFGVPNALPDPILELHNSNGMLLVSNDNWQDDPASAAQLTAHGLALLNPFESGLFISLPPGLYTAILAGNNAGIGVGLVEVYNVQ